MRVNEHHMTTRCRIARDRAKRALEKAEAALVGVQRAIDDARDDLAKAEYDLSINEGLDEGRYGKARVA